MCRPGAARPLVPDALRPVSQTVGAGKAFKTTKKLLLHRKSRQKVCGNALNSEKKACEGEFFVKKVRCNMAASKRAIFSHSPIAK